MKVEYSKKLSDGRVLKFLEQIAPLPPTCQNEQRTAYC